MNVWLSEEHTAGYAVHWRLRDIIHVEQTPYQELAIVDTHEWGRALILDSIVQTTEVDEFIKLSAADRVETLAARMRDKK
jgi:spermidine synthase